MDDVPTPGIAASTSRGGGHTTRWHRASASPSTAVTACLPRPHPPQIRRSAGSSCCRGPRTGPPELLIRPDQPANRLISSSSNSMRTRRLHRASSTLEMQPATHARWVDGQRPGRPGAPSRCPRLGHSEERPSCLRTPVKGAPRSPRCSWSPHDPGDAHDPEGKRSYLKSARRRASWRRAARPSSPKGTRHNRHSLRCWEIGCPRVPHPGKGGAH